MLSLEGILGIGSVGSGRRQGTWCRAVLKSGEWVSQSSMFPRCCKYNGFDASGLDITKLLYTCKVCLPARPRHGVLGRLWYYFCLIAHESHEGRGAGHIFGTAGMSESGWVILIGSPAVGPGAMFVRLTQPVSPRDDEIGIRAMTYASKSPGVACA